MAAFYPSPDKSWKHRHMNKIEDNAPVNYNADRIAHHSVLALETSPAADEAFDRYPTLNYVFKPDEPAGLLEETVEFSGPFWDIFKDVLNIAAQKIHIENRKKGFWPNNYKPDGLSPDTVGRLKLELYPETHGRNVGEVMMLCVTEQGEGFETYRKGGIEAKDDKLPKRSGLYTEMVDDIIRILDFLGGMEADVGDIVVEKRGYNTTREFLHGKKF